MRTQTIVIALTATLAVPGTASAQVHELGHWLGISSDVTLTVPGLAGEHAAKVVAPRNLLEQIRGGTLRELELDVPAGALRNALARSGTAGGRVGTVRLKVRDQTGAEGWIELHSVQCGTCGTGSAAGAGRLMLRFHEDFIIKGGNAKSSPAAAGRSEPTGSIEYLDPATAAQRGDGTPDIVVGTHAARVTSAGALQALTVGGAPNQRLAIQVQRGSPLERVLRSSFAGKKAIPELKLDLSAPGSKTRVVVTLFKGRVVGIRPSNSVGMEQITIAYEHMTRIAP